MKKIILAVFVSAMAFASVGYAAEQIAPTPDQEDAALDTGGHYQAATPTPDEADAALDTGGHYQAAKSTQNAKPTPAEADLNLDDPE